MTYRLWLDDARPAPDDTWVVAKHFWDFKRVLKERGVPSFVSFDFVLLGGPDNGAMNGANCAAVLVSAMGHKKPEGFSYEVHSTFDGAKAEIDHVMGYLEP